MKKNNVIVGGWNDNSKGGEPPMSGIEERLVRVETKLENCATKEDAANLRAAISDTKVWFVITTASIVGLVKILDQFI